MSGNKKERGPWASFTETKVQLIDDPSHEFTVLKEALRIDRHAEYGVVSDAMDRCPEFCDRAVILETAARRYHSQVRAEHDDLLARYRRGAVAKAAHDTGKKRPSVDDIDAAMRVYFGEVIDESEHHLIIARGTLERCRVLSEAWQQRRHDLRTHLKRLI